VLNLLDIAARMEAGERFMVKFQLASTGKLEAMTSKLLDVVEEKNRVFVHNGKGIIWIDMSEVLDIFPEE
jgi:hypothetical protein